MKRVCLYHGADMDGQCGGAIYAMAMREREEWEYQLIPADYGMDVPWDNLLGAAVTMIDFSLPMKDMVRLAAIAYTFTWIDHHKSAIREWEKVDLKTRRYVTSVLDVEHSGCELAWMHFFPTRKMPLAVKLLGRYDVWDHSHRNVLEFQYGMRLYDMRPDVGEDDWRWEWLFCGTGVEERVDIGKSILKYDRQRQARAADWLAFTVEWRGQKWLAANAGGGSAFFDSVWDGSEYAGMITFQWDGRQWSVGLYTPHKGVDCGAIAKEYGGGGHPGAAGFKCAELPFVCGELSTPPLRIGTEECVV